MPVAKAAFDNKAQQEAWVQKTKMALWEGRLNDAIAACWALADERRDDDPAATAAHYFQKNRERMDYPTYRAQGVTTSVLGQLRAPQSALAPSV